ncbi:tRNA (adenosine(37)-N6)-threonylcarbamoyltransferase complex dimerization subunit type 1 TsaB [Caenimonas terrae]|uniref:tRNA (Adenosine(37)-N6)-threonylcarbamoyltransferase complex dimerization subunit type 1 TsaB n=1 Tax=Caenimonas terrae TaxID=696074 RepID=A0ABW0NA40_9BURK
MKLLAFDTSTETMSVGVADGTRSWRHVGKGGPLASSALIPAIQALLAQAGFGLRELDAIAFGHGPGSFTGLRTACAVAQGLAFGAGVPVLGIDTLMAVADEAREQAGCTSVVAVLDARMDEVYAGAYQFDAGGWTRRGAFSLDRPEALALAPGWTLAGNAFAAYGDRLPAGPRIACLPDAQALLRLAPGLLAAGCAVPADQALPLYIRDKVAQTTDERSAIKAAARPSP